MSDIPKKLVVDVSNGTSQYVELTAEEIAQREQDALAFAEEEATRQAEEDARETLKTSARAKLIAGQPLTAEEASVLVI